MDLMGEMADYDLEGEDELDGDSVIGDSVLGMSLVGASDEEIGRVVRHRMKQGRPRRRGKPRWRHELAPGVPTPGYGVFPIPLTPLGGTPTGVFLAGTANIEYRTVAQIPFRGERLVANIRRSAGVAQASQVLCTNGVHIGIRPQIGVLGPLSLDDFVPGAFGVRMVMQPATQGAEIRVFAYVQPALAGTATIALSLQILGRVAT
jgi:hypothetical protein